MSKIKEPDWVSDLIIDDIMSLSEDELDQELTAHGFNPDQDAIKLRESLKSGSAEFRKQKFRNIKAELEQKKKSEKSSTDSFVKKIVASGKSAKDFLLEVMVSGKAPGDLTVAFRDGRDITEEEAASIIKDLKDLGYIKDDDETHNR